MDFKDRKLPAEAAAALRRCPIDSIEPYALMIAPVYVFMRRNEKFISVKAPLDFFTAAEIERLKAMETFFMPPFVDSVLPYRDLARRMKMLLGWNPVENKVPVPPAPFELSDAILRIAAPLWGEGLQIEPFFVCVFVNELCALLPGQEMCALREKDAAGFERAVILSSWMVFLALHLGFTSPEYLNDLRLAVFRKAGGLNDHPSAISLNGLSDAGELYRLLDQTLVGENLFCSLGLEFFESYPQRSARKIVSRIKRVTKESYFGTTSLNASIYGTEGFVEREAG